MKNTGWNKPAGAGLQSVCLAEVQDAIVAFIPALEAFSKVFLGRSRFQAEEGVGKIVPHGV